MIELPPPAKHCPICSLDLPTSEFGICRARKSGRNLYCRSCIRKKVTASRRALKEYKAARQQFVGDSVVEVEPRFKLSPVDKVRLAIQRGAHTQDEIAVQARLGKDAIGEAIASLLLWTHEIKTRLVDGTRIYEMNTPVEKPVITYTDKPSLADYLLKRGPAVVACKKVRRVA